MWQTKGLQEGDFGCVAMIRLTGGFSGSVANAEVRGSEFRRWKKMRCAPPPMILERYDTTEFKGWGSANDMTGKELEERGVGG